MKRLAILGSTGSIGEQTLDVVAEHPDRFDVVSIAAGRSVERLIEQAKQFRPRVVSVGDAAQVSVIEAALASHPGIAESAAFASTHDGVTLVHAALVARDQQLPDTDIYDHLRDRLPPYALPADLTWQDAFPRTISDKIDRVALAEAALETRR